MSVLNPASRESGRVPIPALHLPVRADPADVLGLVRTGLVHALHRGELDRLVLVDVAGDEVADDHLDQEKIAATVNGIRKPSRL